MLYIEARSVLISKLGFLLLLTAMISKGLLSVFLKSSMCCNESGFVQVTVWSTLSL
jgi:hypothetical protein